MNYSSILTILIVSVMWRTHPGFKILTSMTSAEIIDHIFIPDCSIESKTVEIKGSQVNYPHSDSSSFSRFNVQEIEILLHARKQKNTTVIVETCECWGEDKDYTIMNFLNFHTYCSSSSDWIATSKTIDKEMCVSVCTQLLHNKNNVPRVMGSPQITIEDDHYCLNGKGKSIGSYSAHRTIGRLVRKVVDVTEDRVFVLGNLDEIKSCSLIISNCIMDNTFFSWDKLDIKNTLEYIQVIRGRGLIVLTDQENTFLICDYSLKSCFIMSNNTDVDTSLETSMIRVAHDFFISDVFLKSNSGPDWLISKVIENMLDLNFDMKNDPKLVKERGITSHKLVDILSRSQNSMTRAKFDKHMELSYQDTGMIMLLNTGLSKDQNVVTMDFCPLADIEIIDLSFSTPIIKMTHNGKTNIYDPETASLQDKKTNKLRAFPRFSTTTLEMISHDTLQLSGDGSVDIISKEEGASLYSYSTPKDSWHREHDVTADVVIISFLCHISQFYLFRYMSDLCSMDRALFPVEKLGQFFSIVFISLIAISSALIISVVTLGILMRHNTKKPSRCSTRSTSVKTKFQSDERFLLGESHLSEADI